MSKKDKKKKKKLGIIERINEEYLRMSFDPIKLFKKPTHENDGENENE